jgi:hypothetical protein
LELYFFAFRKFVLFRISYLYTTMKRFKFILTTATAFLLPFFSVAQCAMCKAVAESGSTNGQHIANGLNYGIIYLMLIPYLLLMFFFRKKIWEFVKNLRSTNQE